MHFKTNSRIYKDRGKNSHFQQTASCVSWNAKWESSEWSPLPSLLWHRHTRNGPRCEPPKGRHRVSIHVTWYRSKSNVRYLQCLQIRKLAKKQVTKNYKLLKWVFVGILHYLFFFFFAAGITLKYKCHTCLTLKRNISIYVHLNYTFASPARGSLRCYF